jgi:hypothetical protein
VLCGPFTAIPALFLAKKEMDSIQQGRMSPATLGQAKAAFWVSIVALILTLGGCMLMALGMLPLTLLGS